MAGNDHQAQRQLQNDGPALNPLMYRLDSLSDKEEEDRFAQAAADVQGPGTRVDPQPEDCKPSFWGILEHCDCSFCLIPEVCGSCAAANDGAESADDSSTHDMDDDSASDDSDDMDDDSDDDFDDHPDLPAVQAGPVEQGIPEDGQAIPQYPCQIPLGNGPAGTRFDVVPILTDPTSTEVPPAETGLRREGEFLFVDGIPGHHGDPRNERNLEQILKAACLEGGYRVRKKEGLTSGRNRLRMECSSGPRVCRFHFQVNCLETGWAFRLGTATFHHSCHPPP